MKVKSIVYIKLKELALHKLCLVTGKPTKKTLPI
jgi:hypothetical protein